MALGADLVTARGAVASGVNGATLGMTRQAGAGYLVIDSSGAVSGTTDPVANAL